LSVAAKTKGKKKRVIFFYSMLHDSLLTPETIGIQPFDRLPETSSGQAGQVGHGA
jgi:hypothetical protein